MKTNGTAIDSTLATGSRPRPAKGFLLRAAAAGIAGIIVAGLLQIPAAAETPPAPEIPTDIQAPAPPKGVQELQTKVDAEVDKFMSDKRVPGMTVAISKNGKLILTKGYGQARATGGQTLPMRADTRSRIGSSTKAIMTGPSAWELLKADPNVSRNTKLYGPNGFFKGKFDADIDILLEDFEPAPGKYTPTLEAYRKITIQNLFDHTAGFAGAGSIKGAAAMFEVEDEKDVTYEQIHQHFLRTKPLWYEPGTTGGMGEGDRYSNHGFGLLTLVVEQLSGKSFPDYTRDNYLKPMGLHNSVRAEWDNPDSCDSFNHDFDPNNPQAWNLVPFEQTRQGLAAGGLRSSAQDLVRIMQNLEQRYPTTAEIDAMGWRVADDGRIAHGGDITGGNSFMNMYKADYSDPELRGVKIAVVANIWVDTRQVNLDIAKQVADATNLETNYDRWPQALASKHCEYIRVGVSAAEFQSVFSEATRHGYRLEWVDGYTVGGKVFFNSVFRAKGPAIGWAAHSEMSDATFASKRQSFKNDGYALAHVDSYAVGDEVRYAAIWTKGASEEMSYWKFTTAQHQYVYNLYTSQGWTPKVISVAVVNGTPYFTALYTKQPAGSIFAKAGMTSADYQTYFTQQKDAGRKLRYLNAYPENGQNRFSAIWTSEPQSGWQPANHGLNSAGLTETWLKNLSAGYETKGVTGYEDGGQHKFAAFWIK